ncbi:MAG: hypothetical protein Q7J85_00795 [Bacillota bacterium]|nr:hypothetical protein [Bacillota bacterium]
MRDEGVNIIKNALKVVQNEQVVSVLNKKLVDCFENLDKFNDAYDVAVKMFKTYSCHELYLRARSLAVKIGILDTFIDSMLKYVQSNKRYDSFLIMLRILSFEGCTSELINTAMKSDGYSRHDYLKYTCKSLIYRALGGKSIILNDLREFLQGIEVNKIDGIVDMVKTSKDSEEEDFLLTRAIEILKQMVQFHIAATQRSRYVRAAYYCSIIRDIYTCVNEKEAFNQYYGSIFKENNRRPALKDEMKKKIF